MLTETDLPDVANAESRYAALAQLVTGLTSCSTWADLARSTSCAFEELGQAVGVRLWGLTSDGWVELSRYPSDHQFQLLTPRDLDSQASQAAPVHDPTADRTLMRVALDNSTLGIAEFTGSEPDTELIRRAAPVLAHRLKLLSGRRSEGVHMTPRQVESLIDIRKVIREFSSCAKAVLPHDHLSVHLMVADGRAFERYGSVFTPPGESSPVPFEAFGLRHVIVNNEALIAEDLGKDPRLFGSQNRKVAEAGFRGLLSVPLRKADRPFGVLSFNSRTPGFYGAGDAPLAQQMADQIAVFIEHLRRQQRLCATLRHEIHESERNRITREVYYAVAQTAPAISSKSAGLSQELSGSNPQLAKSAAEIGQMTDQMITDMRRTINGISPPELSISDVREAILGLSDRIGATGKAKVTVDIGEGIDALPEEVRRAIVRVSCECLLNSARHSEAENVSVKIESAQDLALEISDDGVGFVVDRARRSDGIGLRHIVELAESVGGYASFASQPGAGATVTFVVPNVREHRSDKTHQSIGHARAEHRPGVLRVLVAAENRITNAGLCRLLERDTELRVVGEIESRDELDTRLRQLAPDLLLVTTRFCDGDLEAIASTMRSAARNAEMLVIRTGPALPPADILALGARGVIDAGSADRELIGAVRVASSGVTVIGSACELGQRNVVEALDSREHLILKLVADGKTNAEIGEQMFLATKTVERQVAAIVRKIGARNRSHAAAIAASQGAIYAHAPVER